MKRILVLVLAAVAMVGCKGSNNPTAPIEKNFKSYLVNTKIWQNGGVRDGEPINEYRLDVRDATWNQFVQFVTGSNGWSPETGPNDDGITWKGRPGPLAIRGSMQGVGGYENISLDGYHVPCVESIHDPDVGVCTLAFGVKPSTTGPTNGGK